MYVDIGRSLSTDYFPIAACRERWFLGPGAMRRAQPPRGTEDPRQDPPFPPGRLDPLADRHPPSQPAAFRKLDAVAVLTARLLPAPQPQGGHDRTGPAARRGYRGRVRAGDHRAYGSFVLRAAVFVLVIQRPPASGAVTGTCRAPWFSAAEIL